MHRFVFIALASGLVSGAAGCKPTAADLAHWKETERGPRKLRDALGRSGLAPSLRAMALVELVELGQSAEALAQLAALAPPERTAILHQAVPRLAKSARGQGVAGAATTQAQREAKDALFTLRPTASAEDREAIDRALIEWTTADLAGRMTAGAHSSKVILQAIGLPAAARLTALLQPGSKQLLPAASLLGQIADAPRRDSAAQALLDRARQLGQIDSEALRALGLIGGSAATAYLLQTAQKGPEALRRPALAALAQGRLDPADTETVKVALRIAEDRRAAGELREAAFSLLEKLPAAVPGLVALIPHADPRVRWRAVEAALAAGKERAVVPVLEALDPHGKYKKDDLDSFVVHDLVLLGPSAEPALRSELASHNPVAKGVAGSALAQLQKR